MQLYTARYADPAIPYAIEEQGLVPVRITRGHPRFKLRYRLAGTLMQLAPERAIMSYSKDRAP